jgi:glutamate transport system substrate-binding protein
MKHDGSAPHHRSPPVIALGLAACGGGGGGSARRGWRRRRDREDRHQVRPARPGPQGGADYTGMDVDVAKYVAKELG